LWQERYRVLFDCNIAGIILTHVDGRIVDCNGECARILGFDSRSEILTHSAWDFYFHREEREALIHRLRSIRNCPAEEVCVRRGDGMPVWILATHTVASFAEHRPELLQGTFIDITEQKQADARLRDRTSNAFPTSAAESENPKAAELFQRLAALLGRASDALQAHNLIRLERAEMQECLLALEEIKMVMSRLEILHLLGK
jgi:PAS domain S-box-containing protein